MESNCESAQQFVVCFPAVTAEEPETETRPAQTWPVKDYLSYKHAKAKWLCMPPHFWDTITVPCTVCRYGLSLLIYSRLHSCLGCYYLLCDYCCALHTFQVLQRQHGAKYQRPSADGGSGSSRQLWPKNSFTLNLFFFLSGNSVSASPWPFQTSDLGFQVRNLTDEDKYRHRMQHVTCASRYAAVLSMSRLVVYEGSQSSRSLE